MSPDFARIYFIFMKYSIFVSFITFFLNILDGKQNSKNFLHLFFFTQNLKVKFLKYFFARKQKKDFCFNQTPGFLGIFVSAELHFPFPFFSFSGILNAYHTFSFFHHPPLSPGQFEGRGARPSKSRLTLNDFVPPAPSRHQDEKRHPRRPRRSHRRPLIVGVGFSSQ